MNSNNQYEDDYYETNDFDMSHYNEERDGESPPSNSLKKFSKKKRTLEDWLEEKRLRDQLRDDNFDD